MKRSSRNSAVAVTRALLKKWPLPKPDAGGDKNARGSILIVGGTEGMPGAVILAANAALRAGAGRLQIAAPKCVAPWIAVSVPESYVLSLAEEKRGVPSRASTGKLRLAAEKSDAILIGPGMSGDRAIARFVHALAPRVKKATIVLDAEALHAADGLNLKLDRKLEVILTPHAGEMSEILGVSAAAIARDPARGALDYAKKFGFVVALKGDVTFIAAPDGRCFRNEAGNVGLATSGSGDTLSGVIAGLAARGADAVQAAVWGVHLHARAGDLLSKRTGPLGYLPRELTAEIPHLMASFTRS